ncbi:hypothetical protein [Thioalbus denitrificans]|uniref:Phage terminase large subunit-like protein n=1 Tax=Thioalbus denitrificans TaxID=547122 RepID=A0A369CHA5_9GAMM|nr:hypothetical protein [Thioalbus denitrificans]RCX32066.1 hypothetical protein DFQ59_102419 [Thioalbus denitrificans]
MPTKTPELTQIRNRCVVDADDFDWWLGEKAWSWQGLDRGDYGLSLDQAQLLYVCEDPVLWARAFMEEPDTGEPYNFWAYQQESVRAWFQDVIHQDGAEVGKTREIVALVLWGMCSGFGGSIQRPQVLVGAPQQTHLDEIIMAIEEHVGEAEGQGGRKPLINRFWLKPKKHPHYMMRFNGPTGLGRVYFRPAGYDGEAFRGVHVNAMSFMDEAAKIKNPVCWSEFHRALKPGCVQRIYSVPDGDNATEYYRMTQRAVANLPADRPGMRLFHWPKTLMPDPFWSEERDREFQRRYGGRDTPGYQRNVLGLHGQQENPVWPWALLQQNIRDVPEYRSVHLVADAARGDLHVSAYRVELVTTEGSRRSPQEHWLVDRDDDLAPFKAKDRTAVREAVRRLLREFITPPGPGRYWCGADLGFAKDPTELMVWREVGGELRRIARIHAKGLGYDVQCELIYCLDELLDFQPEWGIDFGNAGTAVVQMLQALDEYADAHYDERLTGFNFSASVDCIDEEGNVLEEPDQKTGDPKPVRKPAKEWATDVITLRLQRAGYAMPWDPDVIQHYSNHTAREGARNRIFSKDNDHTIDADRVALLRKVYSEQIGVADVFASGVQRRDVA